MGGNCSEESGPNTKVMPLSAKSLDDCDVQNIFSCMLVVFLNKV